MIEKKLQLVIIAQAVLDVLGTRLYKCLADDDGVDEAEAFVLKYPKIAKRLQALKSKEEIESWIDEIEKAMNR
jgi:hypothetical protein